MTDSVSCSKEQKISALEAEIQQLKFILLNSPGHVYWKDIDGRYLGCNKGMLSLHRLENQTEFVGKTLYDFLDKDMAKKHQQRDEAIMQSGKEQTLVEHGVDSQGNQDAIYYTRKLPMKNQQGQVIGLIGISFDITKEKEAETLTQEKAIDQQTIAKLKALAGSIAHEVRTPLSNMSLTVERLQKLLNDFLATSKTLGDHQLELPKALNESRINTEQAILQKLDEVIQASTELIELQLQNIDQDNLYTQDFRVCDIATDVKQAAERFPFKYAHERELVRVDIAQTFAYWGQPVLTQHVIWNLLQNALHFIREADKGDITLTVLIQNNQHQLRVKDTGPGMPKAVAEKIFKPFYTQRSGGTGLGLSFCQSVMDAYKGSITCTSEPGEYAEFVLTFPVDVSPDS